MTRKLLMLVGMLGVCACSLFVRPALAFPLCGPSYCPSHPSAVCQCPPGSKSHGVAPCDTWHADCNFL
jgi:hypothetical protein